MKPKSPPTSANHAAAAVRDPALLALIAETGLRLAEIAKLSAGAALFVSPTTTVAADLVFTRFVSQLRRGAAPGADATPEAPGEVGEPPLLRPKRSPRTTKRGKAAKSVHSRKSQKSSKTPRGRK